MISRVKTVIVRKDHKCLNCGTTISKGAVCSSGVSTDSDIVGYGRKAILYGHVCTVCRDIHLNEN
jgi:hypothetical protein